MSKELLDIYTDYLISQNQYATATGLSALLDGEISHDKFTRFLNKEDFDGKDLWLYIKHKVRGYESCSTGVLILDDSIEEKPYTDENDIVAWHFSHAKGRCIKGINILSTLVRYDDIAFPVGYEIISKTNRFCDIETRKEKRKSGVSKNTLFQQQIKQAIKNQVKFEYILADNWFGSKKNMEFIQYDTDKKFILGMKSNRLIAFSNQERKKGQYHNLESTNFKDGEKKIVWLKDLSFPVSLVKKVFKNEDKSTGTLYLVSNDLDHDADSLYEIYKKRWRIEEYHKSIKQNASLAKSPTKVERSQKKSYFCISHLLLQAGISKN